MAGERESRTGWSSIHFPHPVCQALCEKGALPLVWEPWWSRVCVSRFPLQYIHVDGVTVDHQLFVAGRAIAKSLAGAG